MIVWGSGSGRSDLGVIETRACSTCERERQFRLLLHYRYSHLYYLRWVTKKQYVLACNVCQRGWELDAASVESKLEKVPIPFMTRYGWVFLLGTAGVIVIAVLVTQ
jgi:hypothetical protein